MIPAKYWSPTKRLMLLGAMAGGKAVEDTATGNPLVFFTDLARPLKSLLIPFSPKQEGSGDPSPENIRSILPWNGLTVQQAGANLADFTIIQGGIAGATGAENQSPARVKTKDIFFIKGGGTKYTIDAKGVDKVWVYNYNPDGTYASTQDSQGFHSLPYTYTRNGADCGIKLAFCMNDQEQRITPSVISEIRFQVGTTLSPFETAHVSEHKAVFPSPVYGGTLDVVSGVLTVEYIAHTFTANDALYRYGEYTGGIRINTNVLDNTKVGGSSAICNIAQKLISVPATIDSLSYRISGGTSRTAFFIPDSMFDGGATVDKFKEWLSENEFTICAELETPQEIQLTPAQITALIGDNTIWSDADGSMTAVYLKKA